MFRCAGAKHWDFRVLNSLNLIRFFHLLWVLWILFFWSYLLKLRAETINLRMEDLFISKIWSDIQYRWPVLQYVQHEDVGSLYVGGELYRTENWFCLWKACSSFGHHTLFALHHHAHGLNKNTSKVNLFVVESAKELFLIVDFSFSVNCVQ